MSRSQYWIQLIAYPATHSRPEPHFRAQVMHGDIPVARTVNAWPENGGCGRAAAISEAQAIIGQLQAQSQCWFTVKDKNQETISLKPDPVKPYSVKSVWLTWLFAFWYIATAVWALNK